MDFWRHGVRRRSALAYLAGIATIGSAHAQSFPTRPVRITVAYAAGGSPDTVARIVAQHLAPVLGQPVLVENVPGSSGIAAMEMVRNQPPDGHTLLIADAGHWAVLRATRLKPPYDFTRDVEPVAMVSTASLFLGVHRSVPAENLQELVAAVKARPGFHAYGSSGVGSLHHLSMEAFKAGLGLDILHVPYKGTAQSVPALAAGEVAMAIASYRTLAPFAGNGQLKILATSTRAPSSLLPQVPPMGAAGLRDFHFPGENGLFVVEGTPRAVVDALSAAVAKVMPRAAANLRAAGVDAPASGSPAALAETVRHDITRYAQAVKAAGIQPT